MITKKSRKDRHLEAKKRQKEYLTLTTVQKIKKLDDKFGKGLGAKKERVRLNSQLDKQKKSNEV